MNNIAHLPVRRKTTPPQRPVGRLSERSEPCGIVSVSHLQDSNLRAVSQIVDTALRSLILTMSHDQAEELIQRAVDIGCRQAMERQT